MIDALPTTLPKQPHLENSEVLVPASEPQNQTDSIETPERSIAFSKRISNRYWWYRLDDANYIPPVLSILSEEEWHLLDEWFNETERRFEAPGEISIPGISLLSGIIGGNGVSRVVQCGHYVGYSTLLLGFLLRRMNKKHSIFSVDIDPHCTEFTREWVDRAGLNEYVHLHIGDSSDPNLPEQARSYLGGPIQLTFIDSSHQYAHTLKELDLWYEALTRGGILALHDVSAFAQTFDPTSKGGVLAAVAEWAFKKGVFPLLLNSFVNEIPPSQLVYRDGCGIGIIQKQN
jgi:predicted O-methyltransferase YrrM